MNTSVERRPLALVFKPFVYVAGVQSLLLGLAVILLAGFVGYFSHSHFDGVLDTHTGVRLSLWVMLSEGFIDWICLSVVLLVFGRMFSQTKFRTIDLFGTQALARWPSLCVALLTLTSGYQRFIHALNEQLTKGGGKFDFTGPDAAIFFVVILAMLPFLVWMVALMYQSYSISCNIKGGKAIATFIVGLLVAECLSKFAILGLVKLAA